MALIKYDKNRMFPAFDSLWDNFFDKDFMTKGMELGTKVPAVNVSESENAFELEFAVPGLKKEDFQIDIDKDILTISAETQSESEEKDEENQKVTRREFSYSSFTRSFRLPDNSDEENISAVYNNGILHLNIPKKSEDDLEIKKRIEVN